MPIFSVDSDAIGVTQVATSASIERVRAEVSTLLANLMALQNSWMGQASSAFQQQVDDWRVTQRMVEDALSGINVALQLTAHAYADTERTVMGVFR